MHHLCSDAFPLCSHGPIWVGVNREPGRVMMQADHGLVIGRPLPRAIPGNQRAIRRPAPVLHHQAGGQSTHAAPRSLRRVLFSEFSAIDKWRRPVFLLRRGALPSRPVVRPQHPPEPEPEPEPPRAPAGCQIGPVEPRCLVPKLGRRRRCEECGEEV